MTTISSESNLFDYFFSPERLSAIGEQVAIEFSNERITYNRLRDLVVYFGKQFQARGIAKGDRVALLLFDSPVFVASFLAAASIGAVAVPVNTALGRDDAQFILADSGAKLVIYEADLREKIYPDSARPSDELQFLEIIAKDHACSDMRGSARSESENLDMLTRPEITEETPAFMLYTSGSTGAAKGALHKHRAIARTVKTYAENVLKLTAADRIYSSSRLFFAYGLGNSLSFPLAAAARVILDAERPAAERIAKLFEEKKPTVFFAVPAIYRSLLDLHGSGRIVDTSHIRLCVSAGEALPARIFEDWQREFGLTILDGIGSTEMLHIFISNRESEARAGSSGKPVEGYDARLIDESGKEVAAGEPGNLWVRGKSAMSGYWNQSELTGATIKEGWVRTGDIYRRDEAGFFYHVGRSDDCFKVRGLWVSPIEVESMLLEHTAVQEAAVVSASDKDGLATARAFVVIRKEGSPDSIKEELRNFLSSRLPRYKVPSQIELIDEMPRTSTGKIQRFKLRKQD